MGALKLSNRRAFTLVEVILVIAIIGLLATLLLPVTQEAMAKARDAACMQNLRQLGVALNCYLADHQNMLPNVETSPEIPAYPPEDAVKNELETFGPYGITQSNLKCPADVADPNYNGFAKYGTSYQWAPFFDGEEASNLQINGRMGVVRVSPARARVMIDILRVHKDWNNALYVDGHVGKLQIRR